MTPHAAAAGAAMLTDRLVHRFADPGLLQSALTHRSWCSEHPGTSSNERLEFLGDAVLSLAVAERLFALSPELPEGDLAKVRATLVSSATLSEIAASVGLGEHLRLGRGEEAAGGRHRQSILADAMEAVIGAVYLDAGFVAAAGIVAELWKDRLEHAAESPGHEDFKTRLQELAVRLEHDHPVYSVTGTGPPHAPVFDAEVCVGGVRGEGTGRTKKDAEQGAARVVYEALTAEVQA